ncbi:hypothetical protein CROQUDRAFT_651081 [Cronartium quercuum f. sp. fusiforme G11]|uniref:Maintenance of telomere capping protein 1 n=1 Tax=Cronartium quercuum f. sp. fusiforme G11 TaxID=708437 RepID=A0A9P6TH28_9BASI|nr:hypothetical protein CROQUDRAFT_651081 [Cronartium quercuum f. sp. fusiforme G11]
MTDQSKPHSSRNDVLSFLDDLDSFAPVVTTPSSAATGAPAPASPSANPKPAQSSPSAKNEDAQSVLDFLDEITQRSATPTATLQTKKLNTNPRPLSRKPSSSSITASTNNTLARKSTDSTRPIRGSTLAEPVEPTPAAGGWGWGAVLKQATSSVLNQAKSAAGQVQSVVADPSKSSDLVKNLNSGLQSQLSGQTETARKWKEGVMGYVKASGIDQLGKDIHATGLKSLTDIMNMVAPPIAEHEIIEVQLSYDMIGYDGIETLVYRSLSKVMEQVEGGDLVLNKGEEEKPKDRSADDPERDLQAVEGMTEGYKLALANLEQIIKRKSKSIETDDVSESGASSKGPPITHCPVFVRIQPVISTLPGLSLSQPALLDDLPAQRAGINVTEEKHLFFLILLRDVNNSLDHATLTQSMPAAWLDIPFEENEWVEEIMVEVIRRGTEVIGQQYVNGRLSGRAVKNSKPSEAEVAEAKGAENEKGSPTIQASGL